MTSPAHDIAICGAGPVGLALAALLVQRGVAPGRILLLDAKTAAQVSADPRSIAISYGSRQILEQVGAWPVPAQAIAQIHVSRRGHFGRTLIDCAEYGLPALGYVTRYGALVSALLAATERLGLHINRPQQVSAVAETAEQIGLTLADGSVASAGLLIRAEGGVFADQPNRARHRDYGQSAIVTHVRTSAPLMQRAFERFTAEGPLALLPQDDGYAVVWCARTDTATALMQHDDATYLRAIGNTFGERVGQFLAVGERFIYPLGLNADSTARARSIAIGNAAQTLHPVAGQGMNLGLRDAMVLARLLAAETGPAALARFAAQRRIDRNLAIRVTDTMARVFASAPDGALSQGLLGVALGITDVVAPAKKALANQMMFGWR
ncbi:2-octaprenyl-6-methoxyphenol hydroxylase [Actimicrobium sp. GrIS 1.19]|uniref:FAD-dependent monooxygenase n=1 Tax=Actimicrobium sp. GrIS 1.19 TaxID=3071708 RepID=UPI002E0956C9|nr:2-octaprenyl-6-methoxyphenol hydroxylase [Actimicrobium sp. GrIS 1.19]